MPEQLPDQAEQAIHFLADEERRHDVPADETTIHTIAVAAGHEGQRKRGGGRWSFGFVGWACIGWLVVLFGAAILAPWLPIPDPINDADPVNAAQKPSIHHLMGLDGNGRDILSRVIWGARQSLFIAVVAVLAGLLIGGAVGLIAGYFKGRTGTVLGAATDILLAFPQLVLALAIVSFLGRSVTNVTIALALVSVPILSRITRASTLSWSEREFVVAARAQGAKHGRTMVRDILPNVLPAMVSISLLGIAVAIVAEASLSIIGAGVKPDVVTWGNVIFAGQSFLKTAPFMVLFPSTVIFFTVYALNYVGDIVRSRFDVRQAAI